MSALSATGSTVARAVRVGRTRVPRRACPDLPDQPKDAPPGTPWEVTHMNEQQPKGSLVFLIWSNQHAMWWRPAKRGYTPIIEEAGRYPRAVAERIVADATLNGQLTHRRINPVTGEEYTSFDEVMVPAPETPTANHEPTGQEATER